ncbi:hypothetical protein Tco_0214768 [Tanacetum coccineum]
MEDILKRRHVVFTDSEDEEPEDQGRVIQDINDDPLGSKGDFVTPTKPSGEAQEEEISPTTLEAAKTLSKVASQRSKSVDKGKRYKRRKESKGKDIDSGFEEVNTGVEKVNTGGSGVSTGSRPVSSARGQREGKAPIIVEETQAPKRTKEQIQQEEANLAESIRLQTLEEEETAKQVHLDALLAKRMEEEELTEQHLSELWSYAYMDLTREDLIELYRLVMQKYGTNRPEDAYDKVLWSDLRTMFDPPLNEDAIWSLPLQQTANVADRSQEPVYTGKSSCCVQNIRDNVTNPQKLIMKYSRNLNFPVEDQVGE